MTLNIVPTNSPSHYLGNYLVLLFLGVFASNSYLSSQSIQSIPGIDFSQAKKQTVNPITIRLQLIDDHAFNLFLNVVQSSDIKGKYQPLFSINITYKPTYLNWINENKSLIKAIDLGYTKEKQESYLSFFDPSVNNIELIRAEYPQFLGLDQYVFLKEESPFDQDIDLIDKIFKTPLSAIGKDLHANDMATIIAGEGNTFYTSLGIAPLANIYTTYFQNLLPDPVTLIDGKLIKIQNHSYGIGIENYYGLEAEAYDHATYTNPDFLPIFSAGNRGRSSSESGIYAGINGFANLSGTFKMAKNVLTIGAVDSFYQVIPASSRGPAYDGRVKPDLVAFGFNGSSESAAVASGVATLIREVLIENGTVPISALVRSILINGAEDVMEEGPDYYSGFGNINAYNSLNIAASRNYIAETLEQSPFEKVINVPQNTRSLKATLTWTDPSAQLNAEKALINDLDLKIISPTDTIYPLILDVSPAIPALNSPAKEGIDTLNTVEQITINYPLSGSYRMIVSGPQTSEFSLAYSIEKADTAWWISPLSTTMLKSDEINILRWYSSYKSPPDRISFKSANSEEWQDLSFDDVTNSAQFYPESAGNILEFRLLFDRDSIISDPVLVSGIPRIDLVNKCTNYLVFEVLNDLKDDSLALMKFQDGKFSIVDVKNSNILEYNGLYSNEDYFAVFPYYGNIPGFKSLAVAVNNQFANCFIDNFTAEIIMEKVDLHAEITFIEKVNKVIFEKVVANDFVKLEEINQPMSNSINSVDNDPSIGPNYYRVVLLLENGESIVSDVIEVYYIPTGEFLVFPTIVGPDKSVFILQQEYQSANFRLFDGKGTLVINEKILSSSDEILVDNLLSGLYYFNIVNPDNEIENSGKIIISE